MQSRSRQRRAGVDRNTLCGAFGVDALESRQLLATFGPVSNTLLSTTVVGSAEAADLNNDGRDDLAVLTFDATGTVPTVRFQLSGPGGLAPSAQPLSPGFGSRIGAGKLTPGNTTSFVALAGAQTLGVYRYGPDGTIQLASLRNTNTDAGNLTVFDQTPQQITFADVTGDGVAELLVLTWQQGGTPITNLIVYSIDQATPSVSRLFTRVFTGLYGGFAVGNVNGDAFPDIALAGANVVFQYRQESGGYTSSTLTPSGADVLAGVLLTDLDRDGLDDLVFGGRVTATGQLSVQAFRNSAGTFVDRLYRSLGSQGDLPRLVSTDINRDGKVDVIAQGGLGPAVLTNTSPRPGVVRLSGPEINLPDEASGFVLSGLRYVLADLNNDFAPDLGVLFEFGISVMPALNTVPRLVPSTTLAQVGERLTLDAYALRSDSIVPGAEVRSVRFYRDRNGDGVLDLATDALVGIDANGADGWSASPLVRATWARGDTTFFVVAIDDAGNSAKRVTTTVGIRGQRPSVVSVSVPGGITTGSTGVATVVLAGVGPRLQSVQGYLDFNRNGLIDPGEIVGVRAIDRVGTGRPSVQLSFTVPPSWPEGQHRLYVRVLDALGFWSAPTGVWISVF